MMNDSTHRQEPRVVSIGLLAALVSPELESFTQPLLNAGWQLKATVRPELKVAQIEHWEKEIAGCNVHIYTGVIGRMGQAAAAIETFAFLERVSPSIVFLCGIAGSLKKDTYKCKDVIVAKHVHWKGENKIEDGDPCRIYRTADYLVPNFDIDLMIKLEAAITKLKNENRLTDGQFNVHVEELFSWDYVTSGASITAEILKKHPKSACVEMEAGGFLAAVERYHKVRSEKPILGLVVRGISDYTEFKGVDDEAVRKTASKNAASICTILAEDAFNPSGSNLVELLLT